ncbi:MarR family transcriptional regulator [Paenibacillus sp. LMG 31461]|uniref:MarR family transcriptional regulator n=1 Tax=Paenibacillus plantarum TaxID=2654975 RepID=A0ABX1XPI9_9BACL|nr:MarR family transcriptional regulator [Paenibacillus plantarum]NOU69800.1 MarR family transcriptional regulator [Paenibacillus plantarum]
MEQNRNLQHQFRMIGLKMKIGVDKKLEAYGLTIEQGLALRFIDGNEEGGLSQKDLEKTFNRKGSSISSLVNNLEKKDLIVRKADPKDERRNLLRVTPAGRALVGSFDQYFEEFDHSLLKDFTVDETNLLLSFLARIEANVDEYTANVLGVDINAFTSRNSPPSE